MRNRDTVRPVPNRRPYVSVTLPDGDSTYLRIPSHYAAAELLGGLPMDSVQSLAEGKLTALDAARDVGMPLFRTLGELIGAAWADPLRELESDPTDGAAVFDELHEAGWSLSAILLLGLVVLREVWDALTLEKEVEEKLAFFVPAVQRPPPNPSES